MSEQISSQTTSTPLQKMREDRGFKSTLESMVFEYQKNRNPKVLCSIIEFLKNTSGDFNEKINFILSEAKATENDIKMIKNHWKSPTGHF